MKPRKKPHAARQFLRDRVVAPVTPGVAAYQPAHREITAGGCAMLLERLQ